MSLRKRSSYDCSLEVRYIDVEAESLIGEALAKAEGDYGVREAKTERLNTIAERIIGLALKVEKDVIRISYGGYIYEIREAGQDKQVESAQPW